MRHGAFHAVGFFLIPSILWPQDQITILFLMQIDNLPSSALGGEQVAAF
jgi:hypothetical protein